MRAALLYRCEDRDSGDVFYRVAPTGLFTIHGLLRREGFDSRLYNFSGCSWSEVAHRLEQDRPEVIGVSHFTYNHASSVHLYRLARRACPRAVIVAGGAQATFLAEPLLRRIPELDLVVRGEGEAAMAGVARARRDGGGWAELPGISWRDGETVRHNPAGEPWPDLDALYGESRFEGLHHVPPAEQFGFLVTSRGCPARCRFCSSPPFWGCGRPRFRSVDNVLAEIEFLRRRHGLRYFGIRDDTFTASRERVVDFCRRLVDGRVGILWNCQSRVNLVDSEMLLWMKRAGCEQIQFGVESASPRILARLGKAVRPEAIHRALQECRRVGIRTLAYFITGVPGETGADLELDEELFSRWRLQDAIVSPLCYYPGTELFTEAERQGRVRPAVFLQDQPERLQVRRDPAAREHFERLLAAAERYRSSNQFTLHEIHEHLRLTERCPAALLDLGRALESRGRYREAAPAYQEIVRRWPDNPWGYEAMAGLLAAEGLSREASAWQHAAHQAAHLRPVTPLPALL